MSRSTLGENIHVQRAVRQMISELQLRRRTQATALPIIVHDSQNLFLGRERGRLR
jgi:hypothetical protein